MSVVLVGFCLIMFLYVPCFFKVYVEPISTYQPKQRFNVTYHLDMLPNSMIVSCSTTSGSDIYRIDTSLFAMSTDMTVSYPAPPKIGHYWLIANFISHNGVETYTYEFNVDTSGIFVKV